MEADRLNYGVIRVARREAHVVNPALIWLLSNRRGAGGWGGGAKIIAMMKRYAPRLYKDTFPDYGSVLYGGPEVTCGK